VKVTAADYFCVSLTIFLNMQQFWGSRQITEKQKPKSVEKTKSYKKSKKIHKKHDLLSSQIYRVAKLPQI